MPDKSPESHKIQRRQFIRTVAGGALGAAAGGSGLLTLAGCGGGSGTPQIPQPVSTNLVPTGAGSQLQAGAIIVPPNAPMTAQPVIVQTGFGSSTVVAGQFNVPTSQYRAQLGTAVNAAGNPILTTLFVPGASSAMSPQSTAMSLLLAHPLLAVRDPADATSVLITLGSMSEVTSLSDAISQHLLAGGNLSAPSVSVRNTYQAAFTAIINRIRTGQLSVPSSRSARTRDAAVANLNKSGRSLRGPDRGVRRSTSHVSRTNRTREVSPTYEQSGIIITARDERNLSAITVDVQNVGLRYADLYATPVDSSGQPTGPEQRIGLIGSAGGLDVVSAGLHYILDPFGANLLDLIDSPSSQTFTISLPRGSASLELDVWGLAANNDRAVSDVLSHSFLSAVLTLLLNLGGDVLAMISGVELAGAISSNVQRVLDVLTAFSGSLQVFVEMAINGDAIGATLGLLQWLCGAPEGRTMLGQIASRAGVAISGSALAGAANVLTGIGAIEGGLNAGALVATLGLANTVEIFEETPTEQENSIAFQVTLTWNQPNDIDLHVFADDGEESAWDNYSIAAGSLDVDVRQLNGGSDSAQVLYKGYGPEHFTAVNPLAGRYYIAVNYYRAYDSALPESTSATIYVNLSTGTQVFGPYFLTEPDENDDRPVTVSNQSWWRPCDVVVDSTGAAMITRPDTTISLGGGGRAITPKKY